METRNVTLPPELHPKSVASA